MYNVNANLDPSDLLFQVMDPHQRCLQAKYWNEPKQVKQKSEDLSRSLRIKVIWTFDTGFPTIVNKTCTYITFKGSIKQYWLSWLLNIES